MKKIFTLLFLAALSMGLYAEKQVSGVVVDVKGEPVIGASIQAKGTTQGTSRITMVNSRWRYRNL